MKARNGVLAAGIALLLGLAVAGMAWGALLRPGVTAKDGKSDSVSLTTDSSGTIYAVWIDRRGGKPTVYFNRSADGGLTWLPDDLLVAPDSPDVTRVWDPRVTTDGKGTVYVVWQSVAPGTTRKEIRATSSTDGGLTWGKEAVRLPDLGHAFTPQIVAEAKGRVAVVWYEELKKKAAHGLFSATSVDGGKTWSPAHRMDPEDPPGLLAGQRLILGGSGRLYVVWWETRGSKSQKSAPMFMRSEDFGVTWSTPVRLNLVEGDSGDPEIAADGKGHVYAVWDDARDGRSNIYTRTSADHGKSWGSETRLDGGPKGAEIRRTPQLVVGPDGQVAVAWMSFSTVTPGTYVATSLDGGATWGPERLVGPLPEDWNPTAARLGSDGKGRVAVAWVATPSKRASEHRLGLSVSSDWGQTWTPPAQLAPSGSESASALSPFQALLNPATGLPSSVGPPGLVPTPLTGPGTAGLAPGVPPVIPGGGVPSLTPSGRWLQNPELIIDSKGTVLTIWEELPSSVLVLMTGVSGLLPADLIVHRTAPPAPSDQPAAPAAAPAPAKSTAP